ncbi:MAG: hypothetical protein QOJ89_2651 [bacterium]|jgi:hypothetical protein
MHAERRFRDRSASGARGRRLGAAGAVVATLAIAIPALAASLTPSTFNAGDGNLTVEGSETDWVGVAANKPPFSSVEDKINGTGDNAFGNGTSEDDPVPSLVTDSIPPNKSDITRFLQYNETLGTGATAKTFLYLAWERISDPSGSTNFDFELNKSKTLSTNGVTPIRTAGDTLIKYDLANGGTTPALGYHTWLTGGGNANTLCEASSKFPCWGKVQPIGTTNFQASINAASVTDSIGPGGPRTLSARTFGEAAINLTGAGILPAPSAGVCTGFANAYLKSRSSDSFNAAMKDFAAPLPANISNCKPVTIKIKKVDPSGNPLSGAVMQLYKNTNGTAGIQADDTQIGGDCTTDATGYCPDFTIAGDVSSNGTYIAREKTAPAGYLNTAADQSQVVAIDDSTHIFTLTFADSPAAGKINIHKTDDSTPAKPLANVVFRLYTNTGVPRTLADNPLPGLTCTTNASGDCTINDVPLGTYWLAEVAAPNGHNPAPDQSVTVGLGGAPGTGDTDNQVFVDPVVPGTVKVIKTTGTGAALAGAVFTLVDGNAGTTDPTCTTDDQGKCQFNNVPLGTYTLSETTTPNGYTTAADQTVVVTLGTAPGVGDEDTKTFVDNIVLGTVKVVKTTGAGLALPGAVFTLIDGNAGTTDPTCTTDSEGKCQFTNVPLGTYTLRETTTPNGYTTAADQTVVVTLGSSPNTGDEDIKTFVDNVVPGTVKVVKTTDAGVALAGAVFTLIDGNPGTTDPTCTTDADGKCQFNSVPLGTYTLRETTTPAGYDPADDQTVVVGLGPAAGQGDVDTKTFVDPRKHKVIVIVCHEGSNTLTATDVTIGTMTKQSISTGLTTTEQAALCATGGASFGSISGHPTITPSITVGKVGGVVQP